MQTFEARDFDNCDVDILDCPSYQENAKSKKYLLPFGLLLFKAFDELDNITVQDDFMKILIQYLKSYKLEIVNRFPEFEKLLLHLQNQPDINSKKDLYVAIFNFYLEDYEQTELDQIKRNIKPKGKVTEFTKFIMPIDKSPILKLDDKSKRGKKAVVEPKRGKKVVEPSEESVDEPSEVVKPKRGKKAEPEEPVKPKRGKKAVVEPSEEEPAEEPVKPKRGKKAEPVAEPEEEVAKPKRGKKVVESSEEEPADEPVAKPKRGGRKSVAEPVAEPSEELVKPKRGKKAVVEPSEEEPAEEPVAKPRRGKKPAVEEPSEENVGITLSPPRRKRAVAPASSRKNKNEQDDEPFDMEAI